ncbi:hypothetical protein LB554_24940 [Mesorhizobium sp. CO1-1-11]|uniref:hypothetical protein n=1 Tax=Mesorhizobium sp. CO1-1-11 TaxID=2876636 RepID=UPI001CD013DF|nr:hypothetical protein [Mesorhizobium sp. CO1-1-11]MBZ9727195.1 hypothetical protein [Mesorhizobium sp. CO1-1-11]
MEHVSTIYAESRTLNRVEEVMTDFILCELAGTEPQFIAAIAGYLGINQPFSIKSVRRSVHESSLGETDVELVLENGGSRCGLLIENKIRALRMARQFERYRMRGDEGVAKGLWDKFLVVLAAPQRYVDALLPEETNFLDGYLPYEWIVAWLESHDGTRHAFKIHVLREAIADARAGYSKKRDMRMTAFHHSVYEIASAEFPELRMAWIEKAGHDDSIIHLPYALPGRGDKLLFKAKMGTAEMRIETRDSIGMERALHALIDRDWRTTRAKGYAGVEIAVAHIDPTSDFAEIEADVREFLTALTALQNFYHQNDVAVTIEANRVVR